MYGSNYGGMKGCMMERGRERSQRSIVTVLITDENTIALHEEAASHDLGSFHAIPCA